ncbi:MAG TPA: hypothetical protein VKZ18_15015 [Polyangia bacterium]|nr:hypothetical protein [Polyangia bacterium]
MKRAQHLLLAVGGLCPLLAVSCGSSGGTASVTCTNGTMVAAEENNYAFQSSIMLHPVKVKSMSDLSFDWSGVTKDFQGHAVNPVTDLTTIFLLLVDLPAATFENQLDNDTFNTSDVKITPPPQVAPTGQTSASLYEDFMAGGEMVTPALAAPYLDAATWTPSNSTFAIAAETGPNLGRNIRMLQSFELDDSSTNTMVTLTNTSTTLTYNANLHSLHPVGVPAGTAALTLDWSQIQTNALGNSFGNSAGYPTTAITSTIVGHYSQSLSQLESQFLDLQTIAEDLYTASAPYGTTLDFTTLRDSAGNPFTGVTSDGIWLVGLICGNCDNPAPWYLTVLEPVAQPCK